MRELNAVEIEQVSGGWLPAIQGAIYGIGLLASNPVVRTAATWAAQGIVGGTAFAAVQGVVSDS